MMKSSDTLSASIAVAKSNVVGRISPRLYGGLAELIGEVFTGGLNAELIRNRRFANVTDITGDGTPANWKPLPRDVRRPIEYVTSYNSIAPGTWSCCMFAPGDIPQERGIRQDHIALEAHRPYLLTFYLRSVTNQPARRTVSMLDDHGVEEYEPVSIGESFKRGWRKHTYQVVFPRTTANAELRIRMEGSGCHYVTCVSLLPADNFEGLRADMIEPLRAMGVKLLRFPGGCAAEGYDWRMGIGPKDFRPAWLN
jgi:alpha-N-arabinofuranosidase